MCAVSIAILSLNQRGRERSHPTAQPFLHTKNFNKFLSVEGFFPPGFFPPAS